MPRQELSNVFSDGMMSDLNPINTPKSVLTDCLNGTYITYNGNEFVLQNDMGNYKLKNCKLPTNFIPVGVKGYADILYIVSYNPFTKDVEIGSYPAPQSIFSAGDTESPLTSDDDLSPFKWADGVTEYEYPTIIKDQKKPLFIFTDTNEETFKLYPGDEFKFTADETGLKALEYYYQHLNFYVIDEDNKLYDLDDTLIYNIADSGTVSLVSNEMRKVFWETPGWLAAQYDLYVPDKFNLNLRSLNVPEFLLLNNDESATQAEGDIPLDKKEPAGNQFKVSMDLSSQITITDLLFQAELNKPANVNSNGSYQDLYVRYLIKTADPASIPDDQKSEYGLFQGITYTEEGKETPTDIIDASGTETNENGTYSYFDIHVWSHNYQDDVITAFNNIRPIWFYQKPDYSELTETFDVLNYKGVVEITAYPIIKQHTNNQILKFTQFSTTQRFPLNTLKNSKDIFVANSIYKWSVDDDSCTISFNVDGPFINASDITGRYEIYRINLFDWTSSKPTNPYENGNPISKSKWENTVIPNKYIKSDSNKNYEKSAELNVDNEKIELDWNNITNKHTKFTNETKLLMCEGNISNLVLYGQNTLNIDWDNSDEYTLNGYQNWYTNPDYDAQENPDAEKIIADSNYPLDEEGNPTGSKIIDFSKEGGIYIFRVILEQNGSTLNTTDKILIPSEVFNEWFGSIDNYLDETTGITSSMWVGKWLNQINPTFNLNSLNFDYSKTNLIEGWLQYTWSDKEDWKDVVSTTADAAINELFEIIQNKLGNYIIQTNKPNIYLRLRINFAKFANINNEDPFVTFNLFSNTNILEGNLWNPIFENQYLLKSGNQSIPISFKGTSNLTISLDNYIQNIDVFIRNTPMDVKAVKSESYPFRTTRSEIGYITCDSTNRDFGGGYNDRNRRGVNMQTYRRNSSIVEWTPNGGGAYHWNKDTGGDVTGIFSDNSFFGDIGNGLDNLGIAWAEGRIWVDGYNDSGANQYERVMIVANNTHSAWDYGTEIAWSKGEKEKTGWIVTRALNGDQWSGANNVSVYINFPQGEISKKNFISALMALKIITRDISTKTQYYCYPETSDFPINSTSYTITKFDYICILKKLRVDDNYIYNQNELRYKYTEKILNTDTSTLSNKKEIFNLSNNSITIILKFLENREYNLFSNNYNPEFINKWISDYNERIQIDELNTEGLVYDTRVIVKDSIISTNEGITQGFVNHFGLSTKIETIDGERYTTLILPEESFIQKVLECFQTGKNGQALSPKTIYYNNSNGQVLATTTKYNGSKVNRAAVGYYCYYNNFQ